MELFSRGKARNKASLLPEPHQTPQHVTPSVRSHSLPPSLPMNAPTSPGTTLVSLIRMFRVTLDLCHAFRLHLMLCQKC
jgi:hypothetical protein